MVKKKTNHYILPQHEDHDIYRWKSSVWCFEHAPKMPSVTCTFHIS